MTLTLLLSSAGMMLTLLLLSYLLVALHKSSTGTYAGIAVAAYTLTGLLVWAWANHFGLLHIIWTAPAGFLFLGRWLRWLRESLKAEG